MAKARDSLSALFSDTASVQDSVFGKIRYCASRYWWP